MKTIAVIGGGISGLTAAYRLAANFKVTLFEQNDYLGGHTQTHRLVIDGQPRSIDTGFIVYNDRTYPKFMALLKELGCEGQPTEMSFSLKRPNLEYNGHSLKTLFAQKSNVLRPRFWRMLRDILRFNRAAKEVAPNDTESLIEFCRREGLGDGFIFDYLVPMAAAIWSTGDEGILSFPIGMLAQFFSHHGLLDLKDRPQWYVVKGGSNQYVKAIRHRLHDVRLESPVRCLERRPHEVLVTVGEQTNAFDEVVMACHSGQALEMLADASTAEREVLGAMRYSGNDVLLHQDARVMPARRDVWASWNYHAPLGATQASLTYDMNRLQSFASSQPVLVTLNDTGVINHDLVLKRLHYEHPVFDAAMLAAQRRHAEISGINRTHYCGAYWRYGFHEDGVVSALRVVDRLINCGA
tara:strand:+ start:5906 stop:7135 length:1230 start_codon:yes stop_codon:yes gene_type:complete